MDWECFEDIALEDECVCGGFKAVVPLTKGKRAIGPATARRPSGRRK